ncbi:DUF1934 domain-containing protein [Streptococcus gallolyticus]|uniref:DUF1934 domain-containing protein n=1 Tax=Streptococcus hepaticus TaxID=3349163 RepID=UPI001C9526DD|nr:DUF1934 domain-containing protein [Streptococcus gallolyticus]MBY5041670.1 DUF1934 domain-containing protein [Streptococcus gallolyticus]
MDIRLRNEIKLDDQLEVIDQLYPVELTEKNGQLYLVFTNEEGEKVIIKAGMSDLTMTRFSTPKSIMRFVANEEAVVVIPTPMGLQHFVTDTQRYQFKEETQSIHLCYDLKSLGSDQIFASYDMEISWF